VGKEIIPIKYDSVGSISEGLISVEIDGKWSYINREGEFIIEPIFDEVSKFVDGVGKVVFENRIRYINKNGEYIWKI
jgi:sensor histidine kinase regulating citrate/malate metabolism